MTRPRRSVTKKKRPEDDEDYQPAPAKAEGDEDEESDGEEDALCLSEEEVCAMLKKKRLSDQDKKRVLEAYGVANFRDLKEMVKNDLKGKCGVGYQAALKYLFLDRGLAGLKDVAKEAEQQVEEPELPERQMPENLTPAHYLALGSKNGLELLLELANEFAPLDSLEARVNRKTELSQILEEQSAVNSEGEVRLQYFPKMGQYMNWIVFHYVYNDGQGNYLYATPPFSKPAYIISYLNAHMYKEDGSAYSYSHVQQHVQAINCIYGREFCLYPDLIKYGKPGLMNPVKGVLKKVKSNIVKESIEAFEDRGLGSHMDGITSDHVKACSVFHLSFNPVSWQEASELDPEVLEDCGITFPDESEEDAFTFRCNEVQNALKSFDTPIKLYCSHAMEGVQTNTYVRGQQNRNYALCDVSVMIAGDAMGKTMYPGFERPRLLTFNINDAKTLKGDKVSMQASRFCFLREKY